VQQNVGRGNAGTDMSAIPLTAISHIEILRDGAAAQYGSDAIAGVINIVLKDEVGGQVWSSLGTTSEGDGDQVQVGANVGFEVGQGGVLNLSIEYSDKDEINRAEPTDWFGSIPEPRQLLLIGEAATEAKFLWSNFEMPVGEGELYAFTGYSEKEGVSKGFYRAAADDRVWSALYPEGITPVLGTKTRDMSYSFGYKMLVGTWEFDSSFTYGKNIFEFRNLESLNASYGPDSPTTAYDGGLVFKQKTLNVDLVRSFNVDWADDGMSFATGFEYREDGYEMKPGDPVSYARGDTICAESVNPAGLPGSNPALCNGAVTAPGMQGFQGYRPEFAIDATRDNIALYADTEMFFSEKFSMGVALRYEDYSDFGNTVTGKVTFRFDPIDNLGFRGAVSTGFRAPGMQQRYFTQRSISIINGQLSDLVTLRPGEALANELGFIDLKEEESTSYTFGVVYTGDIYTTTIDLYSIDIDDRIVYSGSITPDISPAIADFFNAHNSPGGALDGVAAVEIFTNAIDTQTRGLDWVNQWNTDYMQYELSFHFNDTDVKRINTSSSIVPNEVVFDQSQIYLVEDAQPGERFVGSVTYKGEQLRVTGRVSHYGEVTTASYGTPANTWGAKNIFDLTSTYTVNENLQLAGGILNLFDEYPDEWGPEGAPFTDLGFKYGWTTFPFSLAGRQYYVKATYNF
jgi:iron complex outermembrane receptor protein